MRNSCKKEKPIYTLDLETDPFKHGRLPKPFAAGLYGENVGFNCWWKSRRGRTNVIKESVKFLKEKCEPGYVFIHNGGKFDIFYYLEELGEKMFILNNRIVVCRIGDHEVRDSYAIMPFALAKYKKDSINYELMEAEVRDRHKKKITRYLKGDCKYLHELCSKFVERFGPKITIGSTALGELKRIHKYTTLSIGEDAEIRSTFYFGGRVQCFEKGVIEDDVSIYDVNSMYPFVMQNYRHPVGRPISYGKKITDATYFVTATGINYGAFPRRNKNATVYGHREKGTYSVSIHEWETAIRLRLFEPLKIHKTINFGDSSTFSEFVTQYYNEREQAKVSGDSVTNLFTKFILNSAYGKFAQNPDNCFDFKIASLGEMTDAICTCTIKLCRNWHPAFIAEKRYVILRKRSEMGERLRVNVATAASITGAARSVLLAAIAGSRRPIYCDTDSLICNDIGSSEINKTKLGAWKLEEHGNRVAIAGRKLYAVFQGDECVKYACKGVKITPEQIERVARGEVITYARPVPSFTWDGKHTFITRRVKLT